MGKKCIFCVIALPVKTMWNNKPMPTETSNNPKAPTSFAWVCDAFAFNPSLGKLYRHGKITHLTPKVAAVLNCLCHRAPHIINKLDILAVVWANQEIADTAVTDAVRTIRLAMAEKQRGNILETVPKQGYRITTKLDQISTQAFDRMTAQPHQTPRVTVAKKWAVVGGLLLLAGVFMWSKKQAAQPMHTDQNAINNIHQRAQNFYTRYNKTGNNKAQALLETALQQYPDEPKLLSTLADVYSQNMDRYADPEQNWGQMALDTALLATEKDPQYAPAWKSLGLAYAVTGQIDQAKAAYRQALALKPDFFAAISNLAHLERVQGHTAAALELFIQGHQLANSDPYIYFHIGNCYQDVDLYDLADSWYQKGLLLEPELTSDQHNYHMNLLRQHKLETLDQRLNELAPNATTYVRYVRMLMAQKSADPENLSAWFDLTQRPFDASQAFAEEVVLLLISEPQLNDLNQADLQNWIQIMDSSYQHAIQTQAQSPTVHYRLAQIRAAQGAWPEALMLLEQAVTLGFRNQQQLVNHSVFKWHLPELTELLKRIEKEVNSQKELIIKLY